MIFDVLLFPIFLLIISILGLGFEYSTRFIFGTSTARFPAFSLPIFGLLTIGLASLLINFFAGVGGAIFYLVMLPFIAAGLFSLDYENIKRIKAITFIAMLLTPFAVNIAPGYDDGLYHLPHQKWIREEAIVLGLANLHSRFGFSSFLEYINAPLWYLDRFKLLSYVQATFLVSFLVFIYQSIISGRPLTRALATLIAINLVGIGSYFPWTIAYTDAPAGYAFALSFVLGLELIDQTYFLSSSMTERLRQSDDAQNDNKPTIFVFLMLSVLCLTLKPSSIVIVIWVMVVVFQLMRTGQVKPFELFVVSLLPMLFLTIWLLRGWLTTGCLLYPAEWSCFQVAWGAKSNAISDANWVTAWARSPATGLSSLEGWDWLWNFWLNAKKGFLTIIGLSSAGVFIACAFAKRFFRYKHYDGNIFLGGGVLIIALALSLWFLKAPDPRFGIGSFILFAPLIGVFLFGVPVNSHRKFWRMIGITLVGVLVIKHDRLNSLSVERLKQFQLLSVPTIKVQQDKIFGVRPINGDQCWLAEHCAPYDRTSPTQIWGYRAFPHQ